MQVSCPELLENSLPVTLQLSGRTEEKLSVLRVSNSTKEVKCAIIFTSRAHFRICSAQYQVCSVILMVHIIISF